MRVARIDTEVLDYRRKGHKQDKTRCRLGFHWIDKSEIKAYFKLEIDPTVEFLLVVVAEDE